jgi:hypothetical protein
MARSPTAPSLAPQTTGLVPAPDCRRPRRALHNKGRLRNKQGGCTTSQVWVVIEFRLSIDKEIYTGSFGLDTILLAALNTGNYALKENIPCVPNDKPN